MTALRAQWATQNKKKIHFQVPPLLQAGSRNAQRCAAAARGPKQMRAYMSEVPLRAASLTVSSASGVYKKGCEHC